MATINGISDSLLQQSTTNNQTVGAKFSNLTKPVLVAGGETTIIRSFPNALGKGLQGGNSDKIIQPENKKIYAPSKRSFVGFTLNYDDIRQEIKNGNFNSIFIDGLREWQATKSGITAPVELKELVEKHVLNAKIVRKRVPTEESIGQELQDILRRNPSRDGKEADRVLDLVKRRNNIRSRTAELKDKLGKKLAK
jgi:hypothetical protein